MNPNYHYLIYEGYINLFNSKLLNFIFIDFIHILFYLFFLILLFYFKFINKSLFIFLIFLSPTPFIFNINFFENFFPDLGDYLHTIKVERGYETLDEGYLGHKKILMYSSLISLLPIPILFTKISLGFVSKYFFTILSTILYKKNKSNISILFLVLLCPELIMYSSVGLREIIIVFFFSLALIYYYEKKYLFLLIFLIPLFFIKFQIFYFFCLFFLLHQFILLMNFKINFKLKFLTLIFCFLIAFTILFTQEPHMFENLVLKINYLCRKLAILNKDYVCYESDITFVLSSIKAFYHFMFTPLTREKISLLMLAQFLSSMYYFLLILIFLYFSNFTNEIKSSIFLYTIITGIILGLFFINDGLLTRQKFTAFFPFLLFLYLKTNFNYSKIRVYIYERLKLLS